MTRINEVAGTPQEPYARIDGRLKANEGCYYLAGAQGCRDITQGYDTKLRAFLSGLEQGGK